MPPLYSLGKVTVAPVLRLAWRPRVEGLENVPAGTGAVLASNHLSVADELLAGSVVPGHLAFWAKAEYFEGTGPWGWFVRWLLRGLGTIPVDRRGGPGAVHALDAALPVLRRGGRVIVYPEGTRSPDGRLYRGRTGVARLALGAGVPVVPVGVTGTDRVQPIGRFLPRLRPAGIVIRFGEPLHVADRPPGDVTERERLRAVTDEVMAAIGALTGQVYVDEYAPSRPTRRPGTSR